MADECCNSFGGRITIDIGGRRYSARGDITIQPTTIEVAAEANHDGTPYFTAKPVLAMASMTFSEPCGMSWENEMNRCAVNVTIVEEMTGVSHLFTKARIVGRPSINISNGEVSGLSIATNLYRKLSA